MKELMKRCMTVLLSLAMIITYMPLSMITAYADGHLDPDDGTPIRNKSIEDNGDGTYKLTLDVTGDSTTNSEDHKANVIIILDTSGSMNFQVPTAEKSSTGRYGYIGNRTNGFYVQLYDRNGNEITNGSSYSGTLYCYYGNSWHEYSATEPRFTSNSGESTRLAQTKPAVNNLIDTLLTQNQKTSDMIEVSFMTFANSATYRTPSTASGNWVSGLPTATAGVNLKNQVSNITAADGTNWDDALHDAKTLADSKPNDNDKTYIVFFTDGEPTFNNGGVDWLGRHSHGSSQQGGGDHTTDNDIDSAVYEATQLNSDDYELFGIFAYGEEKFFDSDNEGYMKQVVEAANGAGTLEDHGFYANDQESIDNAFAAIAEAVSSAVGLEQVTIADGTTNQVTTQSGDISELLEVDTTSYEYWLTWTVANNGTFELFQNGDTTTYTATVNGDNIVISWKDGDENKSVSYTGTKSGNVVKIKWDKATDFYNIAPPPAQFENGSVNWNLATAGTLLDGVTYSYSFDVYPSQETYDTIAKLKNGEITYNELDPVIKQYIGSDYSLQTNTSATLSYNDARDSDGQQTVSFDNPDPVGISSSKMKVQKHWDNMLDPTLVKEEPITMTISGDGEDFGSVDLNRENGWAGELNIATGIIKVNKTTGQVNVLDPGHDFNFSESTGEGQHHWQLEAATVHPMIINGTLTTLEKAEEPTGMSGKDYYKDGNTEYYRIVYTDKNGQTTNYGVFKATSTATVTTLEATNHRRGYLNLTKAIDGEDAPADAKFDFTIKVKDTNGDDVWFSVYYDGEYLDASEYLDDASLSKVTAEEKDGEKTGYYYVDNNTELKFQLKKGWSLRFLNLPVGTTYSIVEGNSDIENESFNLDSIELEVGTKDQSGQWIPVEDPQDDNVSTKTASGTLNFANSAYDYVFTNKYAKESVEVTKIWDDDNDQDDARLTPDELKAQLILKANDTDVTAANADKLTVVADPDNENNYLIKWTGLDRFANNTPINYTVEERDLTASGYTAVYKDAEGEELTGHTVDHGTITNSRPADTIDVTVVKKWNDDSDRDGVRPQTIDVKLIDADGVEYGTATLGPDQTGTTVSGNNWSYTWTGLQKNKNKLPIQYTVDETLPAGAADEYTPVAPAAVRDSQGNWTVTVENTHEIETRSYTVTKVWNDAEDKDDKRPDSLDVYLVANGKRIDSSKQTLSTTDTSTSYTWNNLPVNEDGDPIIYSAVEDSTESEQAGYLPPSYTPENPTAENTATVIENKRVTDKTTYTVVKVWDDNNDQDGDRPDGLEVQLYVDGEDGEPVPHGATVTLNEDNNWTYIWTNLEKNTPVNAVVNDSNSADTEDEDTANQNEEESAEEGESGKSAADAEAADAEAEEADVEESAEPADEAVEAAASDAVEEEAAEEAEAEDVDEEAAEEAEDVQVIEDAKEEKAEPKEEKSEVKAEPKAEPVRATEIAAHYTADETAEPEGYEKISVDSESIPGQTTITNKHTPETTSVTVKKIWDDANNQDGKRPATITMTLSNGIAGEEQTVSLNANDDWTATISGLPKYRNGGQVITYTWTEATPEGYELTDTKVEGNTTTFTNTHTPAKITLEGEKTWADNNNAAGGRPVAIEITLLANGVKATVADAVKTVTANENWKYKWENLDKFKDGQEIVYTIVEKAVEGYTTTYDGMNVTNTPENHSLTVEKTFSGLTEAQVKAMLEKGYNVTVKYGNETKTLKLTDTTGLTVDGLKYTWTITGIPYHTEVTATESGYDAEGYTETTSVAVSGSAEAEDNKTADADNAKIHVPANDNGKVAFTNSYVRDLAGLKIVKVIDNGTIENPVTAEQLEEKGLTFTVEGPDDFNGGEDLVVDYNDFTSGSYTIQNVPTGDYKVTESDASIKGYTLTTTYATKGSEATDGSVTIAKDGTGEVTVTNTYDSTSYEVEKVWKDSTNNDGKRPESVDVTLYQNGEVYEKVTLTEDGKWTHKWPNLETKTEAGDNAVYSIKEMNGNAALDEGGELPDTDPDDGLAYTVSYTEANGKTTVTNSRDKEQTKVEGQKIWNDDNNAAGGRPAEITVQLVANGADVVGAIVKATAANNWKFSFENLDKYLNGQEINYSVREEDVTGYDPAYVDGNIINTPENHSLTVEKTFSGLTEAQVKAMLEKGYSITVKYGNETKTLKLTDTTGLTVDGLKYTWTIADIPYHTEVTATESGYDAEGYTETASVEVSGSAEAADNKEADADNAKIHVPANDNGKVAFTNSYDRDFAGLKIVKVINNGTNETPVTVEQLEEKGLTFTVEGPDDFNGGEDLVVDYSDFTNGSYTIPEEVPTGDYKVTESDASITGYTLTATYATKGSEATDGSVTIAKNSTGEVTVTNKYEADTVEATVIKTFSGDGVTVDNLPKKDFVVTATYGGSGHPLTLNDKENLEVDGLTYTWTIKDVKYGEKIEVTEDGEKIKGFTLADDSKVSDEKVVGTDKTKNVLTLENKYESTSYEVEKVWEDSSNNDGKRPESVDVTLYQNDEVYETVTLTEGEDGKWTHEWQHLETKTEDGEDAVYSIKEMNGEDALDEGGELPDTDPDDGLAYTVSYTEADGKTTVTNSRDIELTKVKVIKKWTDDSNYDGRRPASIDVQLKADGENIGAAVTIGLDENGNPLNGTTVSSDNNSWSYEWTELPVYKEGEVGTPIVYTVDETEVPEGYSKDVKETEGDATEDSETGYSIEIENTIYEVETRAEGTSFDIHKVDQSDNDLSGVEFVLHSDTEGVDPIKVVTDSEGMATVEIPVADGWLGTDERVKGSYSFQLTETKKDGYDQAGPWTVEVVPKKNAAGEIEVEYNFDEEKSLWDRFIQWITKSNTSITYEEGVATISNNAEEHDFAVVKKFDGIDELPSDFQIDVTYTKDDGTPGTATLKATASAKQQDGSYRWTVEDARFGTAVTATESGYDAAGYTETTGVEVKGGTDPSTTATSGTFTMPGNDNAVVEFTNTYENTKLTLTKVWDDNNDAEKNRPDSVTVNLYQDNGKTPYKTETLSKANNWQVEWSPIETGHTYTVDEVAVPGYTKTVSAVTGSDKDGWTATVTNKYTPPVKTMETGSGDTIRVDGEEVFKDDVLTYNISYTNTTNAEIKVDIEDTLPTNTTYVDKSANYDGDCKDGKVTWTQVAVPAGETFTFSFKVKVTGDAITGEPVKNTANVSDGTNDYTTNETSNPTGTPPTKDVTDGTEGADETSINGNLVQKGQKLNYKVTYKNTTGKAVDVLTITDKIPNNTTYVADSAAYEMTVGETTSTGTGAADAEAAKDVKNLTWTVNDVPNGATVVATFQVTVNENSGVAVENISKVEVGENGPKYDTNKTTNPTPTDPEKTVFVGTDTTYIDGKPVEAGQDLTYTIKYTNTTGKDAETVTITDAIPAHTTYNKDAEPSASYDEDTRTLTWTIKNVPNGESREVTFSVNVDNSSETVFTNTGHVNDGTNESGYDSEPVKTSKPGKDVVKYGTTQSIDNKLVKKGDKLTYVLTYTNSGTKDQKVSFTDTIPGNTKFVEADKGGENVNGTVTWPEVTLKPTETYEVKFTVEVIADDGNVIENEGTAIVDGNKFKTNITENPVPDNPDKEVWKGGTQVNANGKAVLVGEELTYAIKYKNTTGTDADVMITDPVPEGTTFVSADNKGELVDGTVTWNIEKLKAGDEITVTFKVKVNADIAAGEELTNTAKVKDITNDYVLETNPVTNPTPRQLVITKDLKNWVDDGSGTKATFAFKIEGTSEAYGGTYSTVVALEFDGKGSKDVTVKGIPADIEGLKVTEVVSGNYEPDKKTKVVAENEIVLGEDGKYTVTFNNKYKDTEHKTGTINNYKRGDDGKYKANGTGDNRSQKPTQTTEQPAEETQPNESGN